jgi:glycosyltransferase involved in cell wall biosynthesis
MRIGIVSPVVVGFGKSPDTYSSQQINLAVRWANSGHHVDVLTLPGQGLEAVDLRDSINVHLCKGAMMGSSGLPLMQGVRATVRDGGYDLVLSSEHYQPATAQACLGSSRVLIYQGQNWSGASLRNHLLLRALELSFGRISRRRCMGVVAKTRLAADFVKERGYTPVEVIPCGYDETRFSPPEPEQRVTLRSGMGLSPDALVLVYAGNLIARRDVGCAVKALAGLRQRGMDVHLLIAGVGVEKEKLQQLADEMGVQDRVRFLGLLPWERLRDVYWTGDVFVFPSQYEIFGLVILEAMACGMVVMSTPVGAASDVIVDGENGYIVPIGSPETIAGIGERLACDASLLHRVQARALGDVQRLTWRTVSQRMIDYYEGLSA